MFRSSATMLGRELTRREPKSYTKARAELIPILTGNCFWTLRGSFSGLSHVSVTRTPESDKNHLANVSVCRVSGRVVERPNYPKRSDGGASRRSCEGGAQKACFP